MHLIIRCALWSEKYCGFDLPLVFPEVQLFCAMVSIFLCLLGAKGFIDIVFVGNCTKKNLRNSKAARGETRYSEGPLYIELNIKSHLLSVIVSVNPDDQTALM